MNDIGKTISLLIIGIGIGYFLLPREKEIVKETVTVEIPVPSMTGDFEPIEKPEPITITEYVVDNELVEKYKKVNDSLKMELFKSAVTERDYEETFDDTLQTITVKANVTGVLNTLSASYITKPFTISKDTVVEFKVPANKKSISLYGEAGMSIKQIDKNGLVFKAGLDIKNKKNWVYGASYDTEKRVWLKVGKVFNF